METEYNMYEYYSLLTSRDSNGAQQNSCRGEIQIIEDRIGRLKEAYRSLDEAKESIDELKGKHSYKTGNYEIYWKGGNANWHYTSCESEDMYVSYDEYVSSIDNAEDAINWEINRLKEKLNEQYGILEGLVNAWNDLCTRINNFFN